MVTQVIEKCLRKCINYIHMCIHMCGCYMNSITCCIGASVCLGVWKQACTTSLAYVHARSKSQIRLFISDVKSCNMTGASPNYIDPWFTDVDGVECELFFLFMCLLLHDRKVLEYSCQFLSGAGISLVGQRLTISSPSWHMKNLQSP